MHWFGNMKCVRLRDGWTSQTYEMEGIERVFLTVQPVDADKERSEFLLNRCASTHVLVKELAGWKRYMNGDHNRVAYEWITRTLNDDATPDDIDSQTERLSAVMRSLLKTRFVRDADNSERPAGFGVHASLWNPRPSRIRRQTFVRKLLRPEHTSVSASYATTINLETLD